MKISDVLWTVANRRLLLTGLCGDSLSPYICDLVDRYTGFDEKKTDIVIDYLKSLGMDTGYTTFNEFWEGPDRQQARYNWLMFAYEVALEEGL